MTDTRPLDMPETTLTLDSDISLEEILDEQPPEDCAHIVKRAGSLGAGALVEAAADAGIEIQALCGYRWVPKGKAPDDLPPCRRCVEIWQNIAS